MKILAPALILLFLALTNFVSAQEPTPAPTATEIVKSVQAELIASMKEGDKLTTRQRYERLKPMIESTHDMEAVAKVVLARAWSDLTDEQKATFTAKFAELSIAMYAANFASFTGEEFKFLSEETVKEKQVLIRTELITKNGTETHTLDYQVGQTTKGWRILNIIVDGVSDLALKRSEYAAVISSEGFDALLKKLDEKIDETFNNPPPKN